MSEPHEPAPYDIEPTIVRPDLPGEVIVRASHHEAEAALAADLLLHAHNCVRAFGDFHLCLSGDASIEPVLLRLLTDPAHRELPWRRTHLWLFAERLGGSAERELIHETVAIHADLPGEQMHAIDTTPGAGASRYEDELRETLAWREKGHDRFDFALLAPASAPDDWASADEGEALVCAYSDRIACTRRLINASRFISVYAVGAHAQPGIGQTVGRTHPLSSLDPVGGVLRWYLDEEACPKA